MPAIVTFDPIDLIIEVIDTGGDNEIDVREIYSEWKDWVLGGAGRLGYPPAFRYVGADPISDTSALGSTYFILNGWRIKPAERDHNLLINGNLYVDGGGTKVTAPTVGTYRVEVTRFVSNLIDASLGLDLFTQLLPAVYFDAANGVAGTTSDVGTPTRPVNNNADAFTILTARNLSEMRINGAFTLDRSVSGLTFTGLGNHTNNDFAVGGYDVDKCLFDSLNMSGTMSGRIEARHCGLNVLAGVDGVFVACGLLDDFTIAASGNVLLRDCYAEVPENDQVAITLATSAMVQLRNYSGGVEFKNFGATNIASVDLDPGRLELNADCTGGAVLIRGVGDVIRNDGGAVTVSDSGMVYGGQLVLGREADMPDAYVQQLP